MAEMESIDLKYSHAITIEHAAKYQLNGFHYDDIQLQIRIDDETVLYKYSNELYFLVKFDGYDFIFRSNGKFTVTLGKITDVAVLEWV